MTLTLEELIANRVSAVDPVPFEIEGLGEILLRPLSRHEVIEAGRRHEGDTLAWERYVLACAIVEPKMGEHDVAAWQKGSLPSEINAVADKVNEISGLKKGADKSSVEAS